MKSLAENFAENYMDMRIGMLQNFNSMNYGLQHAQKIIEVLFAKGANDAQAIFYHVNKMQDTNLGSVAFIPI